MLRILGGFAASMLVIMAAVAIAISAGQGEQWQVPIDDPASLAPSAALHAAALSAPVESVKRTADGKIVPPPDPVGRAKFPGENPADVDGVAYVNKLVNQSMQFVSDQDHYGVIDRAVAMPADFKGDCEDYALTKQAILVQSGVPVVEVTRLRLVYVLGPDRSYNGHAILEVRMPHTHAIAILDNNFDELMTRPELEKQGYQFIDWQE